MHPIRLTFTKIWRITCANALAIAGGISLLFFVEGHMYTIALWLTVISLAIFYYAAYRDFGDLEIKIPAPHPFIWQKFIARLWHITLENALWLLAGLTYLLFLTGPRMMVLTTITVVSFVLMYIDAYRELLLTEQRGDTNTPDTMRPPPKIRPRK